MSLFQKCRRGEQPMRFQPFLWWTSPAILLEIYSSAVIEFNTLVLQQFTLLTGSWTRTDHTLGVDHTLPGDVVRAGSHRPSHPARSKSQVALRIHACRRWDHGCYPAVSCHPAERYLADNLPDQQFVCSWIMRGGKTGHISSLFIYHG